MTTAELRLFVAFARLSLARGFAGSTESRRDLLLEWIKEAEGRLALLDESPLAIVAEQTGENTIELDGAGE